MYSLIIIFSINIDIVRLICVLGNGDSLDFLVECLNVKERNGVLPGIHQCLT